MAYGQLIYSTIVLAHDLPVGYFNVVGMSRNQCSD